MGYGGKLAARTGDVRRFNFTGNGSNTAFSLGFAPATQNQLIVTINGVVQHYDAFSVSGSTINFTGTPASGDAIQVTAVVDAIGVMGIVDGAVANVSSLRVTTTPVLIGNAVGTFTGPLIQAASSANSWIQINAQNLNNGNNASTDMVLARSDGNDTSGFIDVGINSNTYAQAGYSIMTPNSGYMFTNGGDLFIGTQTAHAVAFHTGNTTAASERMRINANGHITMPSQPAFLVIPTSATSITSGSVIAYNNVKYNDGNTFNTSTYTFTAPVSGRYLFSGACILQWQQTGRSRGITMAALINGTLYPDVFGRKAIYVAGDAGSWYDGPTFSHILKLNANDSVKWQIQWETDGGLSSTQNLFYHGSYISGMLLG